MHFIAGLSTGLLIGAIAGAAVAGVVVWRMFREELRIARSMNLRRPANAGTQDTSIAGAARRLARGGEPARFVPAADPREEQKTDLQQKIKQGIHPGAREQEEQDQII